MLRRVLIAGASAGALLLTATVQKSAPDAGSSEAGTVASLQKRFSPGIVLAASRTNYLNNLDALFKGLEGIKVDRSDATRRAHGKDLSYNDAADPTAVAYPESHDDVVRIVNTCAKYGVPIIPYGSGTSLEGHTVAPSGGLCVSLSKMARVLELHEDDMDVVVEPGITYNDLNDYLKPMGLFFPVDPGPGASIGGMVATGCSGTHAVKYGTMRDNVLSMTVVTADGKTIRTGSRAKKTSAGYSLKNLFVGSEGTLGVVTEVVLKLKRLPTHTRVALVTFPSIEHASRAVARSVAAAVPIGRAELMDDEMVKAVNLATSLGLKEATTLILEFTGGSEVSVTDPLARAKEIAQANGALSWSEASSKEATADLWRARKEALFSAKALVPNGEVLVTDVCVPISRLPECLARVKGDIDASRLHAPIVAHAGDGNIHLFIVFDPAEPTALSRAKELNHRLVAHSLSLGGTITGEHGVGVGKRDLLIEEHGPDTVAVMRKIKDALDPQGIFNPGKIFK